MASARAPVASVDVERVRGCCNELARPLPARRAEELALLHRALGDPTRVQMVHMLKHADEPVCVCDFTAVFDLGQPTVSHHLARLREAGIITSARRGVWTFHELHPRMSAAARAMVDAVR